MFKNTQDLLEFIENAKRAKLKSFQIGDVKVEFSDYAFLEQLSQLTNSDTPKTEEKSTSKTLVDTLEPDDEEELLFWSAKS